MKYKSQIANPKNYGKIRNLTAIKYIVVHYTGNDGDTDEANARYFQDRIVGASAHYFVDNDSVTQSVPDNYIAWAVGGKKYPDCSSTGGGEFYGKCTNSNSISVELCDTKKDGISNFSNDTMTNAFTLIRSLMDKYGVDESHVIRHFDVTGKKCPLPLIKTKNWTGFLEKMRGDDCMTQEEKNAFSDLTASVERLEQAINKTADRVTKLENPVTYDYIDGNMPLWIISLVLWGKKIGIIKGDESGRLGITIQKAQNLAMIKSLYDLLNQ